MEKQSQLTRMCISCGQQKPLAAFLQFGPKGATYGAICATCRSAQASQPKPKEQEEQTTSSTGYKIDAKAKMKLEQEKKQQFQRAKVLTKTEKRKKEKSLTDNLEKTERIEKAEKWHREDYLKTGKKESFIGGLGKGIEEKKQAAAQHQTREEARKSKGKIDIQAMKETELAQEGEQQEQKLKGHDFISPYLDPVFGEIKYQSPIFQQFRNWLGSSAPITFALERLFSTKEPSESFTKRADALKIEKAPTDDPVINYINRNWSSSRK